MHSKECFDIVATINYDLIFEIDGRGVVICHWNRGRVRGYLGILGTMWPIDMIFDAHSTSLVLSLCFVSTVDWHWKNNHHHICYWLGWVLDQKLGMGLLGIVLQLHSSLAEIICWSSCYQNYFLGYLPVW